MLLLEEMFLDTYTPLKRIRKYKLKFQFNAYKNGLQTTKSVKKKLLKSFINNKNHKLEEYCGHYKKYRNLLSTLMKKNKQTYYN